METYRTLTTLIAVASLAAVVTLLTLLSGSLVAAQQGDPSEYQPQGGDAVSSIPADTDATETETGLIQYAPSTPGDAGGSQAVPVCPGPAAPGTARCHSLVRTDP